MSNINLGIENEEVAPALQKARDLPEVAEVESIAKYPQSPIHPQLNKITQGIVVCVFDGADKKLIHMTENLGVIESYNASTVSAADANNQGGASNNRATSSRVATSATVGILTPRSISGGVSAYAISNTDYDISIGRTDDSNTGTPIRVQKATELSPSAPEVSFGDRNVFNMTSGKVVNFWVKNRAKISFWCGSGETYSDTVRIDVNRAADGTSPTYDLTGKAGRYEVEIPGIGIDGYISIANATVDKCYVMGVNITAIQDADSAENYDSFTCWYHNDYLADSFYWIGSSNGANDFALRRTGGKTFGSFHGGHSNEVLTFDNGRESIDSGDFVDDSFNYGRTVTFTSESDLTDSVITATCTQKVTFSQGFHRIESSVVFDGSYSMTNMYTGMTCSNERFNQVVAPIAFDVSSLADSENIPLGPVSECIQNDPVNNHQIETNTTWFNHDASTRSGMYILNRDSIGDKKVYLDSMDDSDKYSKGFTAITYHTFKG